MISLPIDTHLDSILKQLSTHKNLILKASPGSGKTTRLPAAILKKKFIDKKIIVLVPKRIAATSAADRIASENNWQLGDQVGYHVRFDLQYSEQTNLIFMTEGLFIKKATDVNFWNSIGLLIFDEFHERSAIMDMILGLAVEKQLLDQEHLKIIVMSATLNSKALEQFLPDQISIEIDSAPFPLQIKYSTKAQRLVCDQEFYNQVVSTIQTAWNEGKKDVLVFLPGYSEIKKTESWLQKKFLSSFGSQSSAIEIKILHSSIHLAEQKEILKKSDYRRIILSTDIAESSVTLPSVDAVVDTGLKKVATTEVKIGFNQLDIQRISLFSAKQRAGRAARTAAGTAYRVWHESDERSMPEQIKPEILSSDLTEEILTLLSCDVSQIKNFSWLDKPSDKQIQFSYKKLLNWKLIEKKEDDLYQITDLGKKVQTLPLDLQNSLLFLELSKAGFQEDASFIIAALETADLNQLFNEKSFQNESDLDRLFSSLKLNAQGQKIKNQLDRVHIQTALEFNLNSNFREILIQIFFKYFPNRIAKKKSALTGTTSLGRGIQFLPGLHASDCEYSILLAGFNSGENLTDISFAVGFSKDEFLKYSADTIKFERNYQIDVEKKVVYKTEVKRVGQFVISESTKTPLSKMEVTAAWPEILNHFSETLLNSHPDFLPFIDKLNFLESKSSQLGYDESLFYFKSNLPSLVVHHLSESMNSLESFFEYPLFDLLIYFCPEVLQKDLLKLPNYLTLPSGKKASLDYLSEKAPMISVKIQDIFGWNSTPCLLDERLTVTLELLAPNMRPTQITQNLKLFWQNSYFEIRKELKARYPKHPWPDNPAEYKHEKRK